MDKIREKIVSDPIIYMDGIHDDTEAIQAAIDGRVVRRPDGRIWRSEPHKEQT